MTSAGTNALSEGGGAASDEVGNALTRPSGVGQRRPGVVSASVRERPGTSPVEIAVFSPQHLLVGRDGIELEIFMAATVCWVAEVACPKPRLDPETRRQTLTGRGRPILCRPPGDYLCLDHAVAGSRATRGPLCSGDGGHERAERGSRRSGRAADGAGERGRRGVARVPDGVPGRGRTRLGRARAPGRSRVAAAPSPVRGRSSGSHSEPVPAGTAIRPSPVRRSRPPLSA
jgi:hypothetical protein